jgi:hypothetical protein
MVPAMPCTLALPSVQLWVALLSTLSLARTTTTSPYFSSAYSDWNIGDGNPLGNLLNGTNKTKNWTADVNALRAD